MSAYINKLRRNSDFDAMHVKVLNGEIALCPNCFGEGETMEWYIDQDLGVIYEYPPCPLCTPERVATDATPEEETPL